MKYRFLLIVIGVFIVCKNIRLGGSGLHQHISVSDNNLGKFIYINVSRALEKCSLDLVGARQYFDRKRGQPGNCS